jgi:hypothetical protein
MSAEYTLMTARQGGGDAASIAASQASYEAARSEFDELYADAEASKLPTAYAAAFDARRALEAIRAKLMEAVRRADSARYVAEDR